MKYLIKYILILLFAILYYPILVSLLSISSVFVAFEYIWHLELKKDNHDNYLYLSSFLFFEFKDDLKYKNFKKTIKELASL